MITLYIKTFALNGFAVATLACFQIFPGSYVIKCFNYPKIKNDQIYKSLKTIKRRP